MLTPRCLQATIRHGQSATLPISMISPFSQNPALGNLLQQAVAHHQAGKLQEAKRLYRSILQANPNQPDANHNLGLLAMQLGQPASALPHFEKAWKNNPADEQFCLMLTDCFLQLDKADNALRIVKNAMQRKGFRSDHARSLLRLAESIVSGKRPTLSVEQEALTLFKTRNHAALEAMVTPLTMNYPNWDMGWQLLGLALLSQNKGGLAPLRRAVELNPGNAEGYYNLGIMLNRQDRISEAEASFKRALEIRPDYHEAHYNLAVMLDDQGRISEAEAGYRRTLKIRPDCAEAHNNLGVVLKVLGQLDDALDSYRRALQIDPGYAEAHYNMGVAFLENNNLPAALDAVIQSIKIKPTADAKILFIEVTKKISLKFWDLPLSKMVIAALLEPWGRPADLMPFACQLLKADTEFMQVLEQTSDNINQDSDDDILFSSFLKKTFNSSLLLNAMLSSSPIADAEMETFCTAFRRHLLKVSVSIMVKESKSDDISALHRSLAQQCFINEYVYFQTPEEIDGSEYLRDRLTKALENDQLVPAACVMAVACYFPLYSVNGAEKLLKLNWPEDVEVVLKQQIQEPLDELNLRSTIPRLTNIENQVSLAVQSQYEENPYPRWVRLPIESNKKFLNSYIQNKFPFATFRRLADDKNLQILIAGCGTGQQPIGTAQSIKEAKILAIDLSMASLAYAKRKTIELGIESIEYAQADLVKLASLGKAFDVIDSSGVLHHLENPSEGWEVLLSLLRPNGLMKLGFYSELARRDIVRVRNLIGQDGVGSSSQDIRNYRQHLLKLKHSENYGFATRSSDFFCISTCRDLLFHVQEHRMNLDFIANFLKYHDLNFLGFEIDRSVIRAYKHRFPNDPSATNLDHWRIYEEENPDTFSGMYQFWIQKK